MQEQLASHDLLDEWVEFSTTASQQSHPSGCARRLSQSHTDIRPIASDDYMSNHDETLWAADPIFVTQLG